MMRMDAFRNILPPLARGRDGVPNDQDTAAGGLLITWHWNIAWLPSGVATGDRRCTNAGWPVIEGRRRGQEERDGEKK